MQRILSWDDRHCPKGHGNWVFIPASILYSDLYWCEDCECFYEPIVKKLPYDVLNEQYSSDRAADLVKRARFLMWKDSLTMKDMPTRKAPHD